MQPRKVLIIGSGPIVIGQAAEFDYAGVQACLALRGVGVETVLVNSNPATVMTDPDVGGTVVIGPLTVEHLARVIAEHRPDALLPTLGGQTGLNLAVGLDDAGVLDRYGVEMIGAKAGLGYLIIYAQYNFQIPNMYVGILALTAIGLTFNQSLQRVERHFTRWKHAPEED